MRPLAVPSTAGSSRRPDQVGGAGAQVAGGAVGRVAERLDRALHPLEGVGAQQVGAVQRVGHGLARHAGGRGDRGQRGHGAVSSRHACSSRESAVRRVVRREWSSGSFQEHSMLPVAAPLRSGEPKVSAPSPSVPVMTRSTARTRPRPQCVPVLRVRLGDRQVGRPLPRVPGLGQHGRGPAPAAADAAATAATAPVTPGDPDRAGAHRGVAGDQLRRRGARPGARRRAGARRGHPAGRRARRRQVHPAARGRRPDGAQRPARSSTSPGEESAAQVRLRADRCRGVHHELYLAAETDLGAVLGHVEQLRPDLLVVDSVQTDRRPRAGRGARAASARSRRSPPPWSGRPRPAAWPRSWSATSPRTAASPVRGCSSTSSTSCCTSRASAPPGCGWSGR